MKLWVKRYMPELRAHECFDEGGDKHYIDIQVDGGLGDVTDEYLVGKTIEAESLHPHIQLAINTSWPKKEPHAHP